MTSKKGESTPKQKFDSLLIKSVGLNPSLYNGSRVDRDPIWNQIYTDMKKCMIGFEFERKYLPIRWKSIRDGWVRLRKDGKETPKELDFLIQYVSGSQPSGSQPSGSQLFGSQPSGISDASQSYNEDMDMYADNNNPRQEEIEEVPPAIDYKTLQKKEQWLKRTKNLKKKEEEMQILKQIRLANEIKNNPDNLRQIDTNFSRRPRNSNVFATSKNRLDSILEDQAQHKADEDWCELIVRQILSVEDSSKRLQAFDAIILKSKEFQLAT